MDAKTVIGRFVRTLREQKRLTLEQLAARTDITYQYLSGVENGKENFSIEVLEALGKSLGCPLISAAGTICFRERSLTPRTTKSSFVHDQIDLILPKLDISFHTLAAIMDFATLFSTSGTGLALFSGSHLYLNASVCLHALAHDLKFRQI